MQRMTHPKISNLFAIVALTLSVTLGTTALAQMPMVRQASIDYESAGYVTPAGMVHPSMYQGGVMPVGYAMACDGCDAGCDSGCSSCNNCGPFGCGGLLGQMTSGCGGNCGGGYFGGGMGGYAGALRYYPSMVGACLTNLLPYKEAGICAQRWYDVSAEAVFLSHSNGSLDGSLTSLGTGPAGPIVLSMNDADGGDDLELGMRLSLALIAGVGGNLETTYMGNNKWNSSAVVNDAGGNLFSVISNFGQTPVGGFADTDAQTTQRIDLKSEFHSGELNYRRRWMGPYCRFQGSWLVGMRYLRFENTFDYSGTGAGGQFRSSDRIANDLFGGQIGFDTWWNVCSGINFGFGLKGGWVQNDIDRVTRLQANGVPVDTSIASGGRFGTVLGELEAKLVYRFSHSWSFRSAYYAIAIDEINFAFADAQTINNFVNLNPTPPPPTVANSLVLQGVSFGTEYVW